MNVADSQRVGSSLEHLGYTLTETIEETDVIVLNTCVVRQSAEDKAYGRVTSLAPLKKKNPNIVINLMGAWSACAARSWQGAQEWQIKCAMLFPLRRIIPSANQTFEFLRNSGS